MIIHKGTIVVRTGNLTSTQYSEQLEGALFAVTRTNEYGGACYQKSMTIDSKNFRIATTTEIQLYREGIRNILTHVKVPSWQDGFCVNISHDKDLMNKYKNLCLEYNIKFNVLWDASGNYYGIYNEKPISRAYQWGRKFTFNEFQNELILINKTDKKNEKISIITTEQRGKNKGTAITSSKKRQIAASSGLSGNRISTRISTRKIAESKISFRAITN